MAKITIPTRAEIERAMSPAGGWTKAQLAAWGVSWPPQKGWKRRLLAQKPGPVEPAIPFEADLAHVVTALSLCLTDAGYQPRPHRGSIACPKCGGTLRYLAKTSARGTIWGRCDTPDCLSWMV